MDVTLVYAIAFGCFVVLTRQFLWPSFRDLIDQYIQEIHEKIEGATQYREDALSFLNSCKRKSQEATLKASKIVENARLEAQEMEASARKEIALFEHQQKELAAEKLDKLQKSILQRIRAKIAEETLRKVRQKLHLNLE